MRRLTFLAATILISGLTCTGFAQEAPFTFDVQVDAVELHKQASHVHVRCAVYADRNGPQIGVGNTQKRLDEREYKGVISVPVSMDAGSSPEEAKRYACRLRLLLADGPPQKGSETSTNVALRPKLGVPFIPLIVGDIEYHTGAPVLHTND